MKTKFEKLAERIRKEFGFSVTNFQRTYAGHHQRSAGAWVWSGTTQYESHIGSPYSVTELLKSNALILNEQGDEIYQTEATY